MSEETPRRDPYRLIGEIFNERYTIDEFIVPGSFGAVYRATDQKIGRTVAVKILKPDLKEDVAQQARELFQREAQAAGALNHPHIVAVTDVGEDFGIAYLVMEWLEGRTLEQELRQFEKISPFDTKIILEQITSALTLAHKQNIVHRDIKPSNIHLGKPGELFVKVLDFGIAQVTPSATKALASRIAGTLAYMSPEQIEGKNIDSRADIYSLGIVLFQMLSGKLPFEKRSENYLIGKHLLAQPPLLTEFNPEISPEIAAVIDLSLGKRPNERQQSVVELYESYVKALGEEVSAENLPVAVAADKKEIILRTDEIKNSHQKILPEVSEVIHLKREKLPEVSEVIHLKQEKLPEVAEIVQPKPEKLPEVAEIIHPKREKLPEITEVIRPKQVELPKIVEILHPKEEELPKIAEIIHSKEELPEVVDSEHKQEEIIEVVKDDESVREKIIEVIKNDQSLQVKTPELVENIQPKSEISNQTASAFETNFSDSPASLEIEETKKKSAETIPETAVLTAESANTLRPVSTAESADSLQLDSPPDSIWKYVNEYKIPVIGGLMILLILAGWFAVSSYQSFQSEKFAEHLRQGTNYLEKKRYDEALGEFDQAVDINPESAEAFKGRADAYHFAGEGEKAVADYNEAVNLGLTDAEIYRRRGSDQKSLLNFDKAIADYTEAIKTDPKQSVSYSGRCQTYLDNRQFVLAMTDCNKALELNPNDADAYISRGNVYLAKDENNLAIADFNKSLSLQSGNAAAYLGRGNAYYNQENYSKALIDFTETIRLDSKNPPAYGLRGLVYQKTNRDESAISDFNNAILINPEFALLYGSRGRSFLNQKKYNEAIADYTKALTFNNSGNAADFYFFRGIAYYKKDELDKAVGDFTKVINIDPKSYGAYQNRGVTYAKQGKKDLADADFKKERELKRQK